ncbi:hypothetical protein K505DRAFT_339186 [Melanomma pulvis-pyrius CBS 109.77]|uniref:Endo-1,3(4)-beta-glucanase 1 carbohydrate binding domain-containing protein n=1 Tax=Melanomma pulvis-pyrius CBS 109.77 TaxID=1314802 RepID=A0A6A6X7H3_9PLEO|nr:hypothetical protein K505DRAFT_339186 [Melanomma pulvis-pyrius CBS 109.77]
MLRFALFAFFNLAMVHGELCGNQTYSPSEYVCVEDEILCPIINGTPYICRSTGLEPLPFLDAPFVLTVSNPYVPDIDGLPVHASGQRLVTGPNAKTSTYCPLGIEECDELISNRTVLSARGGKSWSLMVQVPGGQQGYLHPGGMPTYTQAHSMYVPPGSQRVGFAAHAYGVFVNWKVPEGWWACRPDPELGDADGVWKIFGRKQGNGTRGKGCVGVNLLVDEVDAEQYWAWQYT